MLTMVIEIDHPDSNGTGYPIKLRYYDSQTGEAGKIEEEDEIPSRLPPVEVDGAPRDALEWIGEALDNRRRTGEDLGVVGRYLHGLMTDNKVGARWSDICGKQKCAGNEVRTRTYIDIRPAGLQRLPWEMMTGVEGDPVFITRGHRVMRGYPGAPEFTVGQADLSLPLRVLVVVCDESEKYRAQDEVDSIYAALCDPPGIWQIEVLREPTWEELRDKLKSFPPQILHVIAHTGSYVPLSFAVRKPGADGATAAGEWLLAVDRIADLLNGYDSQPTLFVLNACQTADTLPAERFRRLGVRAVITTQAWIASADAVCFTEQFYSRLAVDGSIDDAVWQARYAMQSRHDMDDRDWGIPVFTMYGAPGEVITRNLAALNEHASTLMQSGQYYQVELFVDRIAKQQQVWQNLYGGINGRKQKRLVLISGKERAGKTQLLRSCMLTWKLLGRPGVLANMEDMPARVSSGTVLLLKQIGSALLEQADLSQEKRSALNKFMIRVEQIDQDTDGVNDALSPFDGACEELRGLLVEVAAGQPFLLGLDHMEQIFSFNLSETIYKKFLLPIAQDHDGPLRIVFAINESSLGRMPEDAAWKYCVESVTVDFFTRHDTILLGREYGARKGWLRDPNWHKLLGVYPPLQQDQWAPSELQLIADMYKGPRESR